MKKLRIGSPPWTRFELLRHKTAPLEPLKPLGTLRLELESVRLSRLGTQSGHVSNW
jgi:hypothetical protein